MRRGLRFNMLIDWTTTGGKRCIHSSVLVTPVSPNHRQR
jgi:hypothetical protein